MLMLLFLLKRLFDVAFRREVHHAEDVLCQVGCGVLLLMLMLIMTTIWRSRRLVG